MQIKIGQTFTSCKIEALKYLLANKEEGKLQASIDRFQRVDVLVVSGSLVEVTEGSSKYSQLYFSKDDVKNIDWDLKHSLYKFLNLTDADMVCIKEDQENALSINSEVLSAICFHKNCTKDQTLTLRQLNYSEKTTFLSLDTNYTSLKNLQRVIVSSVSANSDIMSKIESRIRKYIAL